MAVLNRPFGRAQRRVGASVRLGPAVLVIIAVLVIVAVVQLVQTSDAATSNFAIQELGKEKLELRTRVGQLEAEIGALSSLSRIEREATERLGLVPPVEQDSLTVNVPVPQEDLGLPTRFAPEEEPEVDEQGSSWWRELFELLPFY